MVYNAAVVAIIFFLHYKGDNFVPLMRMTNDFSKYLNYCKSYLLLNSPEILGKSKDS